MSDVEAREVQLTIARQSIDRHTDTTPSPRSALARPAPAPGTTRLAGWGANQRVDCVVRAPEWSSEIAGDVDAAGTITRGLGRSYGDASVNAGGRVLVTTRLDWYRAFDEKTGQLTCEAGVSLEAIIRDFAPRGWFPMITPGTKYVTVGGCIASDVHGKAHHAHGSFMSCVDAITVLLPSGEVITASRTENADLFNATFGGMGLLGIILTATIRLRSIETTFFRQKSVPVRDLDEMLAAMDEYDRSFPYSVATLDVFAQGARLGRGVLTLGDHARRDELPSKLARDPLRVSPPPRLTVPFELPELTLNHLTLRPLNAVILAIQRHTASVGHYEGFFYPLDMIAHWNRGYGRRGFTQYQFVIPYGDGSRPLRSILTAILASGELPFLNILKRLGRESDGLLSFPREGYTFAIDFPIRSGTEALLHRLDGMVRDAGGRIYLAKDSFVTAPTFRAMYPRLDEWLAIKNKYDPRGVLTSNLSRRVGLTPAQASGLAG